MAATGQTEKALQTLTRVAEQNGKPMLLGRLLVDDVNSFSRGRLGDLLSKELRRTTILLWIIWSTASFAYYGVVLMSTELFDTPDKLCSINREVRDLSFLLCCLRP